MMERLRLLWSDLQAWFLRLNPRERVMVTGAGGATVVLVTFVVLFLLATSADATRRRTQSKLQRLAEAEQLAAGYAEAERARKQAEAALTSSDVSLLTYVNEKGTRVGLDILTLNPKGDVPVGDGRIIESSVEFTLTDVSLPKLVDFLGSLEQGPGVVRVTFLRIEPRPKDGVLTAWTTVTSYRLKAGP
ncbi:MAG TPA: type II secretion system protein GspM [Myxococcaceae bacterium]|jgi:general secretion pathway protein M|nr:type II secretion system protein GspM [Myxococcaceae bacterium]